MADLKGMIITIIGAVSGILISMLKKGYKQIGQGIAIGSLIVGLPMTFFGVSGMGDLSSESKGTLSAMATDLEKGLKDTADKIKGYTDSTFINVPDNGN